jgi:hypothetical protein
MMSHCARPTRSAHEGHCLTGHPVIDGFPKRYPWSDAQSKMTLETPRRLFPPMSLPCGPNSSPHYS